MSAPKNHREYCLKILLCNRSYKQAESLVKSMIPEHEFITCSPEEIEYNLEGVDILLPSIAKVDRKIIEDSSFGLIQQLGVGVDTVDIDCAAQNGVLVANVPGAGSGNAESVAELAVLQMLCLARKLDETRKNLSRGVFFTPTGMALLNKSVCIVGFGDIGKALATRLKPFGMHITTCRRSPEKNIDSELAIERVYGIDELEIALGQADFVVLAVPETKETLHLINEKALAAMKKGSFLINVARGGILDIEALTSSLKNKHLAGAGLDVYPQEPYDPAHPVFLENVVATPHIGGNTDESLKGVIKAVVQNIRLYAEGKEPLHLLNHPVSRRKPSLPCSSKTRSSF